MDEPKKNRGIFMRLTLRTLLAYLDDALDPAQAKVIGQKLAESPSALELVERIRKVTRRRRLSTPANANEQGSPSDPNTVAAYLSDSLHAEALAEFEETCLASDVHLAEVAACHQILTLVLSEQVLVPPTAVRRMYTLAKGRESIPNRRPGNTIPVGGVTNDPHFAADDSDAPFLLGMRVYSRAEPIGLRILKWSAVAALLFGFAVAAVMAWPSGKTVAVVTPTTESNTATGPMTKPDSEPTKANTPPTKTEVPVPVEPMPTPEKPVEPMPMPEKPVELGPPAQPTAGRIAVAKLDASLEQVLVVRDADGDTWSRVADKSDVKSSDRFVCLPGYRAKLRFDAGATTELWGNLPELLGIAVLETAVTPHIAPDGFDAEMTVHVGRVYFNTTKASGAKIRVRFLKEIWDIILPDSMTEVALEISHEPTPGLPAEGPNTVAVFSAIRGTAQLKSRGKEIGPIPAKQIVLWTSKGGPLQGPRAPDPKKKEPDAAYFDRFAVFPVEAVAKPTRAALDKFAKSLQPGSSIVAKLTEIQQVDKSQFTDETVLASRFAVYGFAAIGAYSRILDAVNDPERPFCRLTAIKALRSALAAKPGAEPEVKKLAAEKLRLDSAETEAWVQRLRGLTTEERIDPTTIDQLVTGLSAKEIAERELDFFLLSHIVDPASLFNKDLMLYDAGAAVDRRDAIARLWKRRAEDIKAVLKNKSAK